jgi:hypothetical protein
VNKREKAWLLRKNIVPAETIQDRMKKMKFFDPWSLEGIQEREDFAEKHGRAWWLFTDNAKTNKYKNQWIFQYLKIEEESNE